MDERELAHQPRRMLHESLDHARERAAAGRPVRIGQIGAGKFGTMFLSQVRLTPGMHLVGLADLMPARAGERLAEVGWPKEQMAARSLGDALKSGRPASPMTRWP